MLSARGGKLGARRLARAGRHGAGSAFARGSLSPAAEACAELVEARQWVLMAGRSQSALPRMRAVYHGQIRLTGSLGRRKRRIFFQVCRAAVVKCDANGMVRYPVGLADDQGWPAMLIFCKQAPTPPDPASSDFGTSTTSRSWNIGCR